MIADRRGAEAGLTCASLYQDGQPITIWRTHATRVTSNLRSLSRFFAGTDGLPGEFRIDRFHASCRQRRSIPLQTVQPLGSSTMGLRCGLPKDD